VKQCGPQYFCVEWIDPDGAHVDRYMYADEPADRLNVRADLRVDPRTL
jgi:hypothetical protein